MKRVFVCLALVFVILLMADDYQLQRDDISVFDTDLFPIYNNDFRAVMYFTSDPCTVKSIQYGRRTKKLLADTVFIWQDSMGLPGNIVYKSIQNVNTSKADSLIEHFVSDTVVISGFFWIGTHSLTDSIVPNNYEPYFFADSSRSGPYSFHSADQILWFEDSVAGDYFIRATVSGPSGMSTLKLENNTLPVSETEWTPSVIFTKKNIVIEDYKHIRIVNILGNTLVDKSNIGGKLLNISNSGFITGKYYLILDSKDIIPFFILR